MIKTFPDNRGFLSILQCKNYDQVFVASSDGMYTFRGMHYQTNPYQTKTVKVIQGEAIDFLYNLKTKKVEQYLLDNHKPVYTIVKKILHVKNMSQDTTTDQMIFNIMEKKYNITEKLNNIIKESSVDCLKHTTDDPILNNKCIQFSQGIC